MKKLVTTMVMFFCVSLSGNVFAERNHTDVNDDPAQHSENMSEEDAQDFEELLDDAELVYSDNEILDLLDAIEENKTNVSSTASEPEGYSKAKKAAVNWNKWNGMRVKAPNNHGVWVVQNGRKRLIPSQKVFRNLGFKSKKVYVSMRVHEIPRGRDLARNTHLFTCKDSRCPVYVLDHARKRRIPNRATMNRYGEFCSRQRDK